MRLRSWSAVTAFLAVVLLAHVGLSLHRRSHAPYQCEMTYMHPSYQHVEIDGTLSLPYGLFQYADVQAAAPPQDALVRAIPVLFLPGNGGNYQQVRSLASETIRQAARAPRQRQLQWYAADFRQERSALDGTLLDRQTAFVVNCLRWLRAKHADQQSGGPPWRVILVGHSMGGIVARAALAAVAAEPGFDAAEVLAVVTLASPHQRSPAHLQPALARFYRRMRSHPAPAVPVVSIAGGAVDVQVPQELTSLHGLVPEGFAFEASTEQLQGIWAAADHQAIVWCNQLVVKLAALLLDLHAASGPMHERSGMTQLLMRKHLDLRAAHAADPPEYETECSCRAGISSNSARGVPSSSNDGVCQQLVPERLPVDTEAVQDALILLPQPWHQPSHDGSWWHWELPAGQPPQHVSLVLLVTGAKPCTGYRVYSDVGSGLDELTQRAQPLPPISAATKLEVQDRRLWQEVMAGRRDYMLQAAWLLSIGAPPAGSRFALWLNSTTTQHAQIIAQALSHNTAKQPQRLSWTAKLLRGHTLAAEHELLLQLSQPQPWWLTAGAFELSAQPATPMTTSDDQQPQKCWRPYFRLHCDTASAGASSASDTGVCAAVQRLPLWHSAVRATGSVSLISDPRCSLSLRLRWDGLAAAMHILHLHGFLLPPLCMAVALAALSLPPVAGTLCVPLAFAATLAVKGAASAQQGPLALTAPQGFLLAVVAVGLSEVLLLGGAAAAAAVMRWCRQLSSSAMPGFGWDNRTATSGRHPAARMAVAALAAVLAAALHPAFAAALAAAGCAAAACSQARTALLRQARLLWVVYACALLMAAPSFVARVLLPLSAFRHAPLVDVLLAFLPALLGSLLLQVPDMKDCASLRVYNAAVGWAARAGSFCISVTAAMTPTACCEVCWGVLAVFSLFLVVWETFLSRDCRFAKQC